MLREVRRLCLLPCQLPGFHGDLYGADPAVEFHAYLSPSKKFDTLDELRACIQHAARRAEEYFQK